MDLPTAPPRMQRSAVWRLRLLGGFELDDGRQRLTRLRSRAAMALLARLALAPGRRFERSALAGLLWPEADATLARSRLRQTLSLLKAVLEPPGSAPVLGADRQSLWAEPEALWCDAAAFEADRGVSAGELYRGPLLPGFYDDWVLVERTRLEALSERGAALAANAAPAAPASPPTPRGPRGDRLPQDLTPLIGAEPALLPLLALLSQQRWVTVLGPGGVGKTRLAVEAARRSAEGAALERALFVPLVHAVSAADLLARLCNTLQLGQPADARQQVLDALSNGLALLLLDNAEELDAEAVACAAFLAERLPGVRWLATSRRPLGLDGEQTFTVAPLPLPAPDATLEALAHNPAAMLYLSRARMHRAEIHASRSNQAALTALLQRLEGLPLAIELAAAQARTQGPAELLAALSADTPGSSAWPRRLRRRGARDADGRHGSLWAVIDWSWRLLAPEQQALLQTLCLLPAGVTTALALRMAALSPAAAGAALDDLVAQSLLHERRLGDAAPRWLASEPVRAFVGETLDAAAQRALRARIAAAYGRWAVDSTARPSLEAQRAELGNLDDVLRWALEDGDDAAALRLLVNFSAFQLFALSGPALDSACRAAEACPDPALRSRAQADLSWYLLQAGRRDAARQAAEAGFAGAPPGASAERPHVLSAVVRQRWMDGTPAVELQPLLDEAATLAHGNADWSAAGAIATLRAIMASAGDPPVAELRRLHGAALEAWERAGDPVAICGARHNLAVIELEHGSLDAAAHMLPALIEETRRLGNWRVLANATDAMSQVLARQRRWPEALAMARESLGLTLRFGLRYTMASSLLWNLPRLLARRGHHEDALRLHSYGEGAWQRAGLPLSPGEAARLARQRRALERLVAPARRPLCREQGAAASEAQALAWAFS